MTGPTAPAPGPASEGHIEASTRVDGSSAVAPLDPAELHLLAMSRSYTDMQRSLEDVERHMGRLQRRLQALLRSRRWRAGHAIALSMDRIARRRQEEDPEEGLLLMVREGERLLNRAKERASVNIRTRFLRDLDVNDPVGTWLRMSLTQPTLPAPFSAQAEAVRTHMATELQRRVALARRGADLPAVSVIMPTYQRAGVIGRAISSVLAQSHPAWELLVVDDGSTDDTESVVRAVADDRVRYHRMPANGGVSAARNAGLGLAQHPVIAYLDSDNHWAPDNLLVIAAAFRDHPAASSAYTAQLITAEGSDGVDAAVESGIRFAPFHRALLENRNSIDLNCFSHRRSLVVEVGGFEESMPRLVDWEFILRCTRTSQPLAIPCLLSTYVYGAADDQLTHRYSSAEATKQLDRSLFGETTVAIDLPADARRVHRVASLRLGPAPPGPLCRPLALVLVDEGRGWIDVCTRALWQGQPDLDPVAVVTDGPAGRLLEDHPTLGDRLTVGTLGTTLAEALRHIEGAPDVLVLSSDVITMPGAVAALQRALREDPDLGVVIPRRTILPGTDSYAAHTDHHKLDRELDIALSSAHHNVLGPPGASGRVPISYSPLFCTLLAGDTARSLLLDLPLSSRDGTLARHLFDTVRLSLSRGAAYVPDAKTYHLV